MNMLAENKRKILLIFVIGLVVVNLCFALGLDLITLEWLQENHLALKELSREHFLVSVLIFLGLRFLFAVVSIPGTGILTLAGGAFFGFWLGSLLTALAVSAGVTVAFLVTRHALQDFVRARMGHYLPFFDQGVQRYGPGFLFMLRMIEVFPSFAVNMIFGLTSMKVGTYYLVSLAGFLPGIMIFTNAGSRLAQLEGLQDLADPVVLASLGALGTFPLLTIAACRLWRISTCKPRG
ncbi:TVP38/TMEM64 family protein [Desulfonatronovibrio hydrogenovorans]|uniref:TVP38/TMEM64 family protein n=1 Tax=Desulfonatronovibrio hydrogenovorans TaxID=53245 RepID=UPI000689625A|nr:VTT domain-containing protein [Desulfonatronovibrio hydrogenovorans]